MSQKERANFGSKIGVVLATAGSAVGLGNVWRFPYMTGENGGAVFIILYLACVLFLGIPCMIGEFIIGRRGASNTFRAYDKVSGGSGWKFVGLLSVITGFLITGYYCVVSGWCVQYVYGSVVGELSGDAAYVEQYFSDFSSSPWRPVVWTVVVLLITHFVIVRGVRDGIEKASKLLMPLLFILLSIVLWFFGYNAVTSKYSVYATNILHKDYNTTLLIAQGAAIVSYLPVGIIASKVGRKKSILAGVLTLTVAFGAASLMNSDSPTLLMNILFALAGIGWATINVNSFPMVVELASGGNIGKYTGFYYTASMAAQVATPIVSGYLMDRFGMRVLFPYAAVFVCIAFGTMLLVKHGDSKPEAKKGLEALEGAED